MATPAGDFRHGCHFMAMEKLSCCCFWDHILPQKTNICIYLIYIQNISKCLVVTLTSRDFCGECDFDEISWLFVGFVSPEPSFIETHGLRSDLDLANLVSWIVPP